MKIAKLPSEKRKNLRLILILAIGLPILVFATYQVINLISRASSSQPENVILSNLTTSSVTISWSTEEETRGYVVPVLNGEEDSQVGDSRGSSKRYTHYVELTDLEPNTTYEFLIVVDSTKYSDEEGKEFTFKTAPVTSDTPTPNPIHGSVTGYTDDDVVVYAFLKNKSAYPVSATIPSGGNWIIDLSALRDVDDKSLVIADDDSNLVLVAIAAVGVADVVEGAYSDIFDSNGKLKDTYTLDVVSNTSFYAYFPSESKLEATTVVEEEEDTTDTVVVPDTTEEEEEEEEETSGERVFRLVSDLEWIDMVDTDVTQVTGTTGEDSVLVTNLTDTGFTVLWVSEEKEQGSVMYGTSSDTLEDEAVDERDGIANQGSYYVHSVSISLLEPDTQYYFKVVSGTDEYLDGTSPFTVTTFSTLSSPPPYDTVTGVVSNIEDGNEVVVIAYMKDMDEAGSGGNSVKMSTLTDEDGKWILSIADSRTSDGSEYYEYTDSDDMILTILTTVDTDSQTESMNGISDEDISMTISSSSLVDYTKVELLDAYGVLGVGSVDIGDDDSDSTDTTSSTDENTPQTGIVEDLLFVLFLGIMLVVTAVYIFTKKSKKKSKNMVRSVIS